MSDAGASPAWVSRQAGLLALAQCQLFFIGGAPRSGTTWLAHLLDGHPEVSCRGEGLFFKHLAAPLESLMAARRQALTAKNATVFRQFGGYPLPEPEDAELLLGTAVLAALERQRDGKPCRAVGEKTPENVFFFPRLKRLFPGAKFIGIARDPRDVLTSAWHFFHQPAPGEDAVAAKIAFIRGALPSLDQGARAMLALGGTFPSDCTIVTYETLRAAPEQAAARLFAFLGVAGGDELVAACVARASFAAMSGSATSGAAMSGRTGDGSFFRKGEVGGWRATLTAEMDAIIRDALGWMFPRFGWTP